MTDDELLASVADEVNAGIELAARKAAVKAELDRPEHLVTEGDDADTAAVEAELEKES